MSRPAASTPASTPATTPAATGAGERSALRAVAMPTEHGGWGLTGEPILLGLLVVPSWPGLALGLATVLGFLARTPLRVVLVDRRRGRSLPRTRLAAQVLAAELAAAVALVTAAVIAAEGAFWLPVALAAPLVAVELWFDARSRSRRLAPELAGAIAVSGVGAAIVLAGGGAGAIAAAVWLVMAARSATAIPHVRAEVQRLHGRSPATAPLVAADAAAVALAAGAVVAARGALPGAVVVVAAVAIAWATAGSGVPPKVIGLRQTALGITLVIVTAIGLHLI